MLIAHRIALNPNSAQATYFARAVGTARFAYNWALAEWQRQYEACNLDNSQPKPSQAALRRQLNAIKREQFPWMLVAYNLRGSDWRTLRKLPVRQWGPEFKTASTWLAVHSCKMTRGGFSPATGHARRRGR